MFLERSANPCSLSVSLVSLGPGRASIHDSSHHAVAVADKTTVVLLYPV